MNLMSFIDVNRYGRVFNQLLPSAYYLATWQGHPLARRQAVVDVIGRMTMMPV
jgi:hypothetical protein